MKKLLSILAFIISIPLLSNTYYVSTTGSDDNPGTLAEPFLTWNYGILQLNTGDTLFVRSGVYYVTGAVSISANPNEGTAANPIVVMGYPSDATRPIIDGSLLNHTSLLRIENKYYWTVKDIEIRESHDTDGVYSNFCGINLYASNQIRIENVIVHDIDGQGFRIQDCDTIYIRDCDSYNNYDPYNFGGKADGFQINSTPPTVSMVYFDKCRAWNNSDDGWDYLDNTRGIIDSCWAWGNGTFDYDTDGSGQGFKAGLQTGPPPDSAYIFTNNIAVYNDHGGMRANCNGQEDFIDSRWYNNICAFNLISGFNTSNEIGANMYTNVWRNNISYNNVEGDSWEDASTFIRDHNSWDIIGLTLTDDDFLSVDSTGISAPRNRDGSLPDNDCYNKFLRLAKSSDCVDAGIYIGIDYKGSAPDLGAFETSNNYYVSLTGNDSNPGTITQPWLTWNHAFTSTDVQPGDTVFFRGGVYYTTVITGLGIMPTRNGTVDNWIVYINYPNETPILDCGNITAGDIVYTGLRNQGITITDIDYIKLQGLTIRNVNQYFDRNFGVGIRMTDGNVILEKVTAYAIEGSGLVSSHGAVGGVHRFINCDAYNICDSIAPIGNVGNGFAAASDYYGGGKTYFINCRAWRCADQGFNLASNSYVEVDGCWSFLNTETVSEGGSGGGMGYKMGWQNVASPDLRRVVKNSIAAYNDGYGFFTNENGSGSSGGVVRSDHFNNIAYHNGYVLPGYAWGFIIQNSGQSTEVQQWRNFSNNISYDNSIDVYNYPGVIYSGSNNSWDIPLTITDNDFISVDTTGITAARQLDGSLPNNDFYNYFLKLARSSSAIDAGIDVGLSYEGEAPDLGPFEADRKFYVATPADGGNDANPGTFTLPWASWEHAFSSEDVMPGDTVFIRGGVYYTTIVTGLGIPVTRNGTSDDWIVYAKYPGEEPIMDFGNIVTGDIVYPGLRNDGIVLNNIDYVKLYGLTVRNVKQYYDRNYSRAVYMRDGIVTVENLKVYNNFGHGIHSNHTDGTGGVHRIINCDSYNNCDSLSGSPLGSNAGATGNGYAAWSDVTQGETYFINCRAWGVSDQGWSIGTDAYVKLEGCWSFANKAYVSGGGGGFKMGWQRIDVPALRREVINCVATYNDGYGFFTNENGSGSPPDWYAVTSNHYNNIAYHNGYVVTSAGFGWIIQNTQESQVKQESRNFSNNINYDNYREAIYDAGGLAYYSGSNNSWDIPLTITDNDFVSVDTTGMKAPRQEDGSLPNNDFYNYFLKLSDNSQLIDAGIDVGLEHEGVSPDLGPFEFYNYIPIDNTFGWVFNGIYIIYDPVNNKYIYKYQRN